MAAVFLRVFPTVALPVWTITLVAAILSAGWGSVVAMWHYFAAGAVFALLIATAAAFQSRGR